MSSADEDEPPAGLSAASSVEPTPRKPSQIPLLPLSQKDASSERSVAPIAGTARRSRRVRRYGSRSFSIDLGRRASRSSAMIEDLMGEVGGASEVSARRAAGAELGVPKWLVDQQLKHSRGDSTDGGKMGDVDRERDRGDRGKDRERKQREAGEEDEFVMVDLLDASHLPSTDGKENSGNNRSESDSDMIEERRIERNPDPRNAALNRGLKAAERRQRSRNFSLDLDRGFRDPREIVSKWRRNADLSTKSESGEESLKAQTEHEADRVSRTKKPLTGSSDEILNRMSRRQRRGWWGSSMESGDMDEYCDKPIRRGAWQGAFEWLSVGLKRVLRGENEAEFPERRSLLSNRRNREISSLFTFHEDLKILRKVDQGVYPSEWEWRRPADEDVLVPPGAFVYLALIGWLTFGLCYGVTLMSQLLVALSSSLSGFSGSILGSAIGIVTLVATRMLFASVAFYLVQRISPRYTNGSGIPEMKCVLSGVYMPNALSGATLIAKMLGLTFSLSAGLSIGKLGPFIHISGIIAALISRLSWFHKLRTSARCQLQAVSAAMAAGVGATFGAPIGGTLLSIELMSTYYYIHWLPIALYCTMMGYFLVVAFLKVDSLTYFYTEVKVIAHEHEVAKIVAYSILGIISGCLGALLVSYTTTMFSLRRKYVSDRSVRHGILLMSVFAAVHTLTAVGFSGILLQDQKEAVVNLFNQRSKDSTAFTFIPFNLPGKKLNSVVSLMIAVIVKFLLTGISLVLPVPAGTFMPIFEIGALVGRLYGEMIIILFNVSWLDPRATAIVGAAAVTAGTLHITSIAVVMLELTMQAVSVLPLAFCVVISYAVSKNLCSDLFSELIKLRRLPFILGLRERYPHENKRFYKAVATVSASSFMSRDFPFVTRQSTKGEIRNLLASENWPNCAFLSSKEDRRLLGTISRRTLAQAVAVSGKAYCAAQISSECIPDTENEGGMAPPSKERVEYGSCVLDTFQAVDDDDVIPFLAEFDVEHGHRNVDMGPMIVGAHTPFWKVVTYFRMLGMSKMYVTADGKCVGYLTKAHVIRSSFEIEEKAREAEETRKDRNEGSGSIYERLSRRPSTTSIPDFQKISFRRAAQQR